MMLTGERVIANLRFLLHFPSGVTPNSAANLFSAAINDGGIGTPFFTRSARAVCEPSPGMWMRSTPGRRSD